MKNIFKLIIVSLFLTSLTGCFWGQKVEVPPAHVGKISGKTGYKDGVVTTSKFRLDWCWAYCDKLVILDVSDNAYSEKMDLFMPKDKLDMSFDIRLTLTPNPSQYDSLFDRVPATQNRIPLNSVYTIYAKQIIRTQAREILSQYSIGEIASNREIVGNLLSTKLSEEIHNKTPFLVRHIGLAEVKYPEIITQAQEKAAERREKIAQEEAELAIAEVRLQRELKETQLQRAIDVEKAQAEAQVEKILADSVTEAYKQYHAIQIMYRMAESDNKVIIPTDMVGTIASEVAVAKDVK